MEFWPNLEIKSISGMENRVADAISRSQPISCNTIIQLQADHDFLDGLKSAYQQDPFTRRFLRGTMPSETHKFVVGPDVLLYTTYQDMLRPYVPNDSEIKQVILREYHDIPIAGHLGQNKTLTTVLAEFYWPGVVQDVTRYCQQCLTCQQSKTLNEQPAGLFKVGAVVSSNTVLWLQFISTELFIVYSIQ